MDNVQDYDTTLREEYGLHDVEIEKLKLFVDAVLKAPMNLTAWSREEVWQRGVMDSLALIGGMPQEEVIRGLDIGSGAGFPGVVLAVMQPQCQWVLLEARERRGDFLGELAQKLDLLNVRVVIDRGERWIREENVPREEFDCVTMRAVASTRISVELGLPYLKIGGRLLLVKGPHGRDEVKGESDFIEILGGEVNTFLQGRVQNGEGDWDQIAVIEKVAVCPERFPRKGNQLGR